MRKNRTPGRGKWAGITVLLLAGTTSFGQLVINELCTSNSKLLQDEDGDYADWIELYNGGEDTLNLQGYGLSDEASALAKWTFPPYEIPPGEFLQLFASGKDRSGSLWWHTLIDEGENWRYILPDIATPDNWREPGFDDTSWSTGPSGFGYGDDDDATLIPVTSSLFLRKEFFLEDPSSIHGCVFHMDYDDGFVAFLNGKEIARSGVQGDFPAFNVTAYPGREALMYAGGTPQRFDVQLDADLLLKGENVISIQVHNVSSSSSDLSAIPFLSILSSQKSGESPPEILQLADIRFHTSFKLDADGESVYLTNRDQVLIDSTLIPKMAGDFSYGRNPADLQQWVVFPSPTPGRINEAPFFSGYVEDMPLFSVPPGRFTEAFQLSLSTGSPGDTIYYTLDGTVPTAQSMIYRDPLEITSGIVIRARILRTGMVPGAVVTHTYFHGPVGQLPVVTVSTDPDMLWDYNSGIYAMGPHAEVEFPYFNANFWQDWERTAHIELFDESGSCAFSLDGGIKIYGGWTRGHPQKSLAIFARKQYGSGDINYRLFKEKPITEFEAFVIRNSGNDWFGLDSESGTMFRDILMTRLTRGMDLDFQASRQAVVYVNGQYWGIHNIREKINEHFLASNQGVDPEQLELLEGNQVPIEGDPFHYSRMMDFIQSSDMTREENMAYLGTQMDIRNFINYQVAQIYFDNRDWPGNNIKYWRPKTVQGKWKWILYDTDFGFGLWDPDNVYRNTFVFATETYGPQHPNPPWSTLLLRELLKNKEFKTDFINAFADRLNTNFRSDSVSALVDVLRSAIDLEIPGHAERWGGSYQQWFRQVRNLKDFGRLRIHIMQNHLINTYGLPDKHLLTLDVSDTSGGHIGLNSIHVQKFPWEGIYFQDNPIELTAICKPGFRFAGWSGAVNSEEARISVNLTDAAFIRAHFEPDLSEPENPVIINEICYLQNPEADCEDWIELYNQGNQYMDISGWVLRDSDDQHSYRLAAGTILGPGAYHVVCRDPAAFESVYTFPVSYEGAMNFGLSSNGDAVRLYNTQMELLDSVNYGISTPWPLIPSGSGFTLSLIDPGLDNALASSWESSSSQYGSPGENNGFTAGRESEKSPVQGDRLFQNSPNPFSASTRIVFYSSKRKPVRMSVYDLNGRLVKVLANRIMDAGYQEIEWIPEQRKAGIYILRVVTPESVHTQKMIHEK